MKAIVMKKQGSTNLLEYQDLAMPTPKEDEVLIRVHAATVTRGDVILRNISPLLHLPMLLMGIKKKRIPGHEFAGEVVDVGKKVSKFKVGDKVFGTTTGLNVGANAEYVCVPETWRTGLIAIMPTNASFEEAAALPVGGMTALNILKRGAIKPHQKVLIYGASGSVGSYAVQLAKYYFNTEVTGGCSTKNISMVKSLGADKIIDHKESDFTQGSTTYDVIFDAVGKLNAGEVKIVLKTGGSFLTVKTMTKETAEDLNTLINLFEAGKIKVVMDSTYPLVQITDAYQKVETGHKIGNVVISIIPSEAEGEA